MWYNATIINKLNSVKKEEIRVKLDALNIEYTDEMTKEELKELLPEDEPAPTDTGPVEDVPKTVTKKDLEEENAHLKLELDTLRESYTECVKEYPRGRNRL